MKKPTPVEKEKARKFFKQAEEDEKKGIRSFINFSAVKKHYPGNKDKQENLVGFMIELNEIKQATKSETISRASFKELAEKWEVDDVMVKKHGRFITLAQD